MTTTFVGIDPGKKGAFGILSVLPSGDVKVEAIDIPMFRGSKGGKDDFDLASIKRLLRSFPTGKTMITMEQVNAMPGQGVTSMFSFGKGAGLIEGMLAMSDIPYTMIRPARWKKVMLADMAGDEKGMSRKRACQLFPTFSELFARVRDDGRAEAVLLAEFGRRYLKNEALA